MKLFGIKNSFVKLNFFKVFEIMMKINYQKLLNLGIYQKKLCILSNRKTTKIIK